MVGQATVEAATSGFSKWKAHRNLIYNTTKNGFLLRSQARRKFNRQNHNECAVANWYFVIWTSAPLTSVKANLDNHSICMDPNKS